MEPTKEELKAMEAMEVQYKQDMAEVEELEAKMFGNDEIEAHTKIILEGSEENIEKVLDDFKSEGIEFIDPNGPEELLDTPETTTEISSGDPITCPEPKQPNPGSFLHWLACQSHRDDAIGDLSRNYDFYTKYNNVKAETMLSARTEFEDFQEEEATYRDEQHMLELQKKKQLGC